MKNPTKKEFISAYDQVHIHLSRFCRAISGNATDAEDLMQETILVALENYTKLKNKCAFKAYLFSIASNLNKMKKRRHKFSAEFNLNELNLIADVGQNPEHLTDFQIIYEKMLSLSDKIAETLILFHISDLSLEEIQKIQGGTLSGVKSRLKRGREKLLAILNTPQEVKIAAMFLNL